MFHFHQCCGRNIRLSEGNLVATRTQSFANALVFSQRPLQENEVFLIEIMSHQEGWAGHLRCGITLHNPAQIKIPQYLLPDMYQLGKSYVFPIKPSASDPFNDDELAERQACDRKYFDCIKMCDMSHEKYVNTEILSNHMLELDINCEDLNPCAVGSRIGMFISAKRELFFLINGKQFGPCAGSIPKHCNVFAALDLYGVTSKVKIVNCCGKFFLLQSISNLFKLAVHCALAQHNSWW